MRTIALLLPICALCGLSANFSTSAQAQTPATATPGTSLKAAACVETDRMMDWREITCTLPAGAAPQRFSFRATFTGGHDDTSASIAPELDGQPFACGTGSKLSLFGEDGNVSVFCQFDRSALPAGAAAKLKVLIKWSHAEFADYEFSGD
ncbi:hypothetical protein [Roseateles sp. L2-2]|uniref:hypothetical protein n=1 Tax=Roseateles sp. L2-2 TaxID=3422597 RepID=UPI003D36B52D